MQRRERNWLTVWRSYPCREAKPPVSAGEGDLVYPAWREGKGNVTSTLVGQVARLAPTVVTLGFEINRRHLNEPVSFEVRFQEVSTAPLGIRDSFLPKIQAQIKAITATPEIVADRAFNRLNIAKAYLGKVQFKTLVRLAIG